MMMGQPRSVTRQLDRSSTISSRLRDEATRGSESFVLRVSACREGRNLTQVDYAAGGSLLGYVSSPYQGLFVQESDGLVPVVDDEENRRKPHTRRPFLAH